MAGLSIVLCFGGGIMPAVLVRGETGSGKTLFGLTAPGPSIWFDADGQLAIYVDNPRMPFLSPFATLERDVEGFGLKAGQKAIAAKGAANPAILIPNMREMIEAAPSARTVVFDQLTTPWKFMIDAFKVKKYGTDPEKWPDEMPFNIWGSIKRPYSQIMRLVQLYPDRLFIFLARNSMALEEDPRTGKKRPSTTETKADLELKKTGYETPFHFHCQTNGRNHRIVCEKEKGGLYYVGQEWSTTWQDGKRTPLLSREILEPILEMWKNLGVMGQEDDETIVKQSAESEVFSQEEKAPIISQETVDKWIERSKLEGPAGPWLEEARKVTKDLTPGQKAALIAARGEKK